ncbi:hypothetical protein ACFX2C_028159 [Malus domestica]
MNVFLKRVKKIQLKRAYKIENWYAACQGKAAGEAETDASFRNQVHAWHEEVDCARQGQRDAEGKLSSLEEHMELRKRYCELTDLLVGCRMHVQITRIDEAKNDLVLSEKEAWVIWISTFDLFMFFVACNVLSLFVLRFCDLIFHRN